MLEPDTERAASVALLASALDPHLKHLSFLQMDIQWTVTENLADQYNSLPANDDEENVDNKGYGKFADQVELERYLIDTCIPPNEDPLEWCYRIHDAFQNFAT